MFYIHEVLTDRKHGVATVWLLATLGSKSGVRKLNRRNIQEVNVPKACETIVNPTAPMALRLQGSLLYGVSRAYNKQCEYLYADAESIHRIMNQELHGLRRQDIDLEAGKAKAAAENLTLQDDPAFVPDLILPALDLDLSELPGFGIQLAGDSQQQNNFSPNTSQGSQIVPGLDIASFTESSGVGGFQLPGAGGADQLTLVFGADEGFDPNVDFGFDADGNMIDLSEHPTGATRETPRPVILGNDVSARQSEGHERGARQALVNDHNRMDLDDVPPLQYDDGSDGQPSPTTPQKSTQSFQSPETAIVGLRLQPRAVRIIPMDRDTTLHNRTIRDWTSSYVEHMLEVRSRRLGQKAKSQAKRNAEYWISQVGLGGVGMSPRMSPLSMFQGENFINTIVPLPTPSTRNRKRGREHFDSDDEFEERRRSRDEVEAGLGWGGNDGAIRGPDDEVEVAREAQPELDDVSTVMPWNITASVRGSSAHGLSSIARVASSVKGLTSFGTGIDIRRRDTESPLVGRGTSLGSNQLIQLGDTRISSDFAGPDDLALLGAEHELSEDEEEQVQTQTESQMQRAALDRESDNFLSFIQDGIEAKQDVEEDAMTVTFEELLPSDTTSKMVAAQGLFHVLALGTKDLIRARQDQSFDEIHIGLLVA